MKLLVVFILVILCATHVVCLTIEEQNKLLAELNKDRQEIAKKTGIKFEIVTYDAKHEDGIRTFSPPCSYLDYRGGLIILRATEVTYKLLSHIDWNKQELGLFRPFTTEIGCIKDFACSKITKDFNGTHVQFNGACTVGPYHEGNFGQKDTIVATGLPRPDKYGKLLGISYQVTNEVSTTSAPETFTGNEEANNSSGNVLSIFLSLIIVFYF